MDYINELNNGDGFFTVQLEESELKIIQDIVSNHWLSIINAKCPEFISEFDGLSIDDYHLKSDMVAHESLWPKKARILTPEDANVIKELSFFKNLTTIFGDIQISNEDELYEEEMYWRLVRPNKGDIGPLHADKWFWDLGHGKMPEGRGRVKLWMSLFCQGTNGLRVVPQSHLKELPYEGVMRDGIMKPVFDEEKWDLDILKLNCEPGTVVVFNDKLLHGGCLNVGTKSRVSMEFTMLVNP